MLGHLKYFDPIGVYKFTVEISGLYVAGFSEVSGLESELETEQIYEGGLNDAVHNLPKKMKYGRLILRKGICIFGTMEDWFGKCKNGNIEKRDISISLMDSFLPIQVWNFIDAYPVKYSGPQLDAQNSSKVAIEAIEFVYKEASCCKGYEKTAFGG